MRFLLYNIRYATGRRVQSAWMDLFRRTDNHFASITHFIHELNPDVIGLVETDNGSFRTNKQSQPERLAEAIGHYHSFGVKYRQNGLLRRTPVFSKQGNAFLTREAVQRKTFHYFDHGFKRLVIELEIEQANLFLVHLSLRRHIRKKQLNHLQRLVRSANKPCIVAGDFNVLLGPEELTDFLTAAGLEHANLENRPTYPSWKPNRVLDFVCYTPNIKLRAFMLPNVFLSDHLPLVCDFDLPE